MLKHCNTGTKTLWVLCEGVFNTITQLRLLDFCFSGTSLLGKQGQICFAEFLKIVSSFFAQNFCTNRVDILLCSERTKTGSFFVKIWHFGPFEVAHYWRTSTPTTPTMPSVVVVVVVVVVVTCWWWHGVNRCQWHISWQRWSRHLQQQTQLSRHQSGFNHIGHNHEHDGHNHDGQRHNSVKFIQRCPMNFTCC